MFEKCETSLYMKLAMTKFHQLLQMSHFDFSDVTFMEKNDAFTVTGDFKNTCNFSKVFTFAENCDVCVRRYDEKHIIVQPLWDIKGDAFLLFQAKDVSHSFFLKLFLLSG